MANKKASSSTKTKKSTASRAKSAPSKSASTNVTRVSAKAAPSRNTSEARTRRLDNFTINIVIAEIVGTFILTLVAMLTLQSVMPLYVGLTLVLLVMAIGAVSGSHVNPAVSFGLWSVGKLKTLMLPFYWGAQFIGAIAAFFLINGLADQPLALNFEHSGYLNWGIFNVEMVGMAVFMFGLTVAVTRVDLSASGKAIGIGLSLMAGLLVASSLFAGVQTNAWSKAMADEGFQRVANIPHEIRVKGAVLNPAIALVTVENTDSQLQGDYAGNSKEENSFTRFGWETVLSTLLGAAIGANVARLLGHRFNL